MEVNDGLGSNALRIRLSNRRNEQTPRQLRHSKRCSYLGVLLVDAVDGQGQIG